MGCLRSSLHAGAKWYGECWFFANFFSTRVFLSTEIKRVAEFDGSTVIVSNLKFAHPNKFRYGYTYLITAYTAEIIV